MSRTLGVVAELANLQANVCSTLCNIWNKEEMHDREAIIVYHHIIDLCTWYETLDVTLGLSEMGHF